MTVTTESEQRGVGGEGLSKACEVYIINYCIVVVTDAQTNPSRHSAVECLKIFKVVATAPGLHTNFGLRRQTTDAVFSTEREKAFSCLALGTIVGNIHTAPNHTQTSRNKKTSTYRETPKPKHRENSKASTGPRTQPFTRRRRHRQQNRQRCPELRR